MRAAERWAASIPGATVDAFNFQGLTTKADDPVNDLTTVPKSTPRTPPSMP